MKDHFNRTIDYMRISITDRCNLRCKYCMPRDIELTSMDNLLTYEEILRVAAAAGGLGIKKLKVTGGEPLVRKGCVRLVRELKQLPGIEQVTLTTNGVLLGESLAELAAAGLDGVNISLDTLRRERFTEITGRDNLQAVLDNIEKAIASGIPVKLNVVLQKGLNEDEWAQLAGLARDHRLDVRFIELMPIGFGKSAKGVSGDELLGNMKERWPDIARDPEIHGNGPAVYYHVPGWQGSIGLISAIHGKFCDSCNRIRLTSMGKLKPCLCYGDTVDLVPLLRSGADSDIDQRLKEAIATAVAGKPAEHCFEQVSGVTETSQMVSIGG